MRKLYWEEVAESLDLHRVMDELGITVKDTNRSWLLSSCPLPSHPGNDANPSFGINEDDLIFNCFVCGGGNIPQLVIEIEGLTNGDSEEDTAWQQALRWLAQFSELDTGTDYDPEFVQRLQSIVAERANKPKRVRRNPLPIFSASVLNKWNYPSLEMLAKWNITKHETIESFELRYDLKHERHDYVGPALIIPHFWERELVGYQQRWMDEDRPKRIAKYTNTNNFPKKETLFNWDGALVAARTSAPVLVVESAMTVVRLFDMGIQAVATFGTSVNQSQIARLGALPYLVLSYDNDVAGRRAVKKLKDILAEYTFVEALSPPRGAKYDLADLSEDAVRDLLSAV